MSELTTRLKDGDNLPLQYRTIQIVSDPNEMADGLRGVIDEANRTVTLTFSSEAPVEREIRSGMLVNEILVHNRNAVKMDRLNTRAPLLMDHNPKDQVGVVDKAFIADGKGTAIVRFSKSARGQEIFQDVIDGIRSSVSVGYRIFATETDNVKSDVPNVRVTSWQPHEVSIASIPADISVGVGRGADESTWPVTVTSQDTEQRNQPTNQPTKMEPNVTAPQAPITADTSHKAGSRSFADYSAYQSEIKATADMLKADPGHVADALARNLDPQAFAAELFKANPPKAISNANEVRTMSDKDVPKYSLGRAIKLLADGKNLDGIEKEVHDQMLRHVGSDRVSKMTAGAFFVPSEWGSRAANVGTATAGGYTAQSTIQELIPELNNATALDKLGVMQLNGLTGNLLFPVLSSGTTAYWVAETAALTDSQAIFAQKSMVPHRLGSTVPISTQLLAQSSFAIESVFRDVLIKHMDLAEDLAGLEGTGASGQPIGIKNTSGINATVTYGNAAVWEDVVEHETGIAVDNADGATMAFVLDAATIGKWKTALKVATYGGSGYLIDTAGGMMTANGYKVVRSNQVSGSHYSYFGDFSKLVRGRWLGTEIIVDPYALKKSGQVEITANRFVDFLVTQPLAFNVSTDSAAQ